MAKDPETAAMNFLKALEKLPSYIRDEQKKIEELHKDVPVLQGVVNGTWTKESNLSVLKTELAAVERKIQLSIEPVKQAGASDENAEEQMHTPALSEAIVRQKGVHLPRGIL